MKGFSQCKGTNYIDIYSPVVHFKTMRLILGLAALKKQYITGLDIRNAYLYGKLDEEIYIEQPKGFTKDTSIVLRLYKVIYVLKQAGLAQQHQLNASMKELGFERLKSKARIFSYCQIGTNNIIGIVYIDDTFFYGPNKVLLNKIKAKYHKWSLTICNRCFDTLKSSKMQSQMSNKRCC